MIIFGVRGVTSNRGKGSFYCPTCGSSQAYKHKRVRRFFTLYFIPLIPLGVLGEYVECQSCEGTFDPRVLEYDPAAERQEFEAEFHTAARRVMLHLVVADGDIADEELGAVAEIFRKLTGSAADIAELRSEARSFANESTTMQDCVSGLAGRLNDHGKEMVLTAAFLVGGSDGELKESEASRLIELGKALGMTEAHVRGTLSAAES